MNRYETVCRYNLAETCVNSLTVAELLAIAGLDSEALLQLANMRLDYGEIPGSEQLRQLIAGLYQAVTPDQVLVTHGAAGANALIHAALIGPDDPVVTILPSYQQHSAIPAALGGEVREVWLRETSGWQLDLDELATAASGNRLLGSGGGPAKAIVLTNPNNPTGSLLNQAQLRQIAEIAEVVDAWIIADEVYRGVDLEGGAPSLADITDRAISVGSMSKAFSLAGLRLGWIAGPAQIIEAASIHRDYTTISVGRVDDWLAQVALGVADRLLERSRQIAQQNLEVLTSWLETRPDLSWQRPTGGTTALLRYVGKTPSYQYCRELLDATGVLVTPGQAFDCEGTFRIGFAGAPQTLQQGLAAFAAYPPG
jgi:aspartate/methionine/tyrosine aminotransferase